MKEKIRENRRCLLYLAVGLKHINSSANLLRRIKDKQPYTVSAILRNYAHKLYVAYIFYSRLQCVYRKERPYWCIKNEKFAAACLSPETPTLTAEIFRPESDVHFVHRVHILDRCLFLDRCPQIPGC